MLLVSSILLLTFVGPIQEVASQTQKHFATLKDNDALMILVVRSIYLYDNPVAYLEESIGENTYRKVQFTSSLAYEVTPDLEIKGLFTRKGESNIRRFYQTKNLVSTT